MWVSTRHSHTEGAPAWGSWLQVDDFSRVPNFVEAKRGAMLVSSEGPDHGMHEDDG